MQGGLRADIDDAARAAFQKVGQRGLRGVERGLQVERVHAIPTLGRAVLEYRPLEAPGDVEERVEPAKLRLDGGHRFLCLSRRGEIDPAEKERLGAEPVRETFG